MKVLRWGVCALAALLMTAGSSFANDSEIEAMKAAMDNMKQEMDAMRSTMASEREAMRENAGGAPEALRTKGSNASVRIGGSVIARYTASWQSNENQETPGQTMYKGGEYPTENGWKMDTASVTFDITFDNSDVSAFIDIRPDKFDKAYFQWNNIGGTGLGTQVGMIGIPGGMYSASWNPSNAVLIENPVTKSPGNVLLGLGLPTITDPGVSNNDDITAMGVSLYYTFDQFKITGTVYNGLGNYNSASMGNFSGNQAVNVLNGNIRNGGIDHSLMVEFNPAFLEGLHFSFTYQGSVDSAEGVDLTTQEYRGTSYSPDFDFGVAYVGDKFSAWFTGNYCLNPRFMSNTYEYGLALGANYNITERFAVGTSVDYAQLGSGNVQLKPGGSNAYGHASTWGLRAQFGAKYTFCNGVWLRANYSHVWYDYHQNDAKASPDNEHTRGQDKVTFETGVSF